MPDLNSLKMIGLDALANPITIRYNLSGSWGISSQEITVNVPELRDFPNETKTFVNRLWANFIARAISSRWSLDFSEVVIWKSSPAPFLNPAAAPSGAVFAAPSSRNNTGVIVMHTGHSDSRGRRRLYFPGSPNNWQVNGVLLPAGVDSLYATACTLFMGMVNITDDGPIEWLIAYPHVLESTLENLGGVAFRRVQYLRICSYCGKAPDRVPLDWP